MLNLWAQTDIKNYAEELNYLKLKAFTSENNLGITIAKVKEIAVSLDSSISSIEDAIMQALAMTPPELAADIYNTGIYLAGGGSMLRGLDQRIAKKTDLPVFIAEDPLRAVVRGTGIALKNVEHYPFLMR